ncbi:TPA: hypothetical protein ACGGGC_004672 [Escherichia coli]
MPRRIVMTRIRYLQMTHDAAPGESREVDDRCARVLVLLGKAEYLPAVKRQSRKPRSRSTDHVEPVQEKIDPAAGESAGLDAPAEAHR